MHHAYTPTKSAPHRSLVSKGFVRPLNLYLENLAVRNYSKSTIESQTKQLRYFAESCSKLGLSSPEQVTGETIAAYQLFLYRRSKPDGRPLANSTQRQWLTAVSGFFRFLTRTHLIPSNPAAQLEMPRMEHRLPKAIFTCSEIERVIAVPDSDSPIGLRDRAILEVFYSTGIRRSELCGLNLTDVDCSRRILRVEQGKGKKDRYVPLGRRALAWIEQYLKDARPMLGRTQDSTALFINANGTRLTPDCLGYRIRMLVRLAHIGKAGSCHAFRHSFATALMDNGCDIRHIQLMMGHSKLETTTIYLHTGIHDLKAAHEKYHPASRCDPRKFPGGSLPGAPKQLLLNLQFKPCSTRRHNRTSSPCAVQPC